MDVPWKLIESAESLKHCLQPTDVIVDALLGIGVVGGPRGLCAELIKVVNDSGLPVVSLDVPSGLDANTGEGNGAVRADWTITMAFPKPGLFKNDGFHQSGTVRVIGIGLPKDISESAIAESDMDVFSHQDARTLLPRRKPAGHKNTFGHLLCLCNSVDYSGAGELCAVAALRMGAGLVTLAVPEQSHFREGPAALIHRTLEGGRFCADNLTKLAQLLNGKSAVVYGPGTGAAVDAAFLEELISRKLPMVIDADGLRLLAANPKLMNLELPEDKCPPLALNTIPTPRTVLTPHPGEMRALLDGFGLQEFADASRTDQAKSLAKRTGCVVALKGRFTVVAEPTGRTTLNLSGDVSLATAGSGDVLSGCIGALLAEGLAPADAARLGVFLHGLAAELRHTPGRSLIADDLPGLLPEAIAAIGGSAAI